MGAGGGGVELVRLEDGPLRWKLHHSAKKSAKHCLVCDTYGCLGTTALPEQKFADFFQTRYSDISYIYICQISFTLLRVFHSGRGNNNRHLFNSSFTHIFHPVGFPLTDKSFLVYIWKVCASWLFCFFSFIHKKTSFIYSKYSFHLRKSSVTNI